MSAAVPLRVHNSVCGSLSFSRDLMEAMAIEVTAAQAMAEATAAIEDHRGIAEGRGPRLATVGVAAATAADRIAHPATAKDIPLEEAVGILLAADTRGVAIGRRKVDADEVKAEARRGVLTGTPFLISLITHGLRTPPWNLA
jgi:hypothetical protein